MNTFVSQARNIDWQPTADSHKWMRDKGLLDRYLKNGKLRLSGPQASVYVRILERTPQENEAIYQEKLALVLKLGGKEKDLKTASSAYLDTNLLSPESFQEKLTLTLALLETPFRGTNASVAAEDFRAQKLGIALRAAASITFTQKHKLLILAAAELEIFERKREAIKTGQIPAWFKRIEGKNGLVIPQFFLWTNLKKLEQEFVARCGHDPNQKEIPIKASHASKIAEKCTKAIESDLFSYAENMRQRVLNEPAPEEPVPHTRLITDVLKRIPKCSTTVPITEKKIPDNEEKSIILQNAARAGLFTHYKAKLING